MFVPFLTVLACLCIVYYARKQENARVVVRDTFVFVVLTILFVNLVDVVLSFGVSEWDEVLLNLLKLVLFNVVGFTVGYFVMVLTKYAYVRDSLGFWRESFRSPYVPFAVFFMSYLFALTYTLVGFLPVVFGSVGLGDRSLVYYFKLTSSDFQVMNFVAALMYITYPLVHVLVYLKLHKFDEKVLRSMYLIMVGFAGAAASEYFFIALLPSRGIDIPYVRSFLELLFMMLIAYAISRRSFLSEITGEPEANLGGSLKYKLEKGHTYLVEEEFPRKSFDMFLEQVTHGVRGLCITRTNPEQVRWKYGLLKTPVLWLTDDVNREDVLKPQLEDVSVMVHNFIQDKEEGVILLDGIEYLINKKEYGKVFQVLDRLKDKVSMSSCRLILPINPKALKDEERALLERELKDSF